MLDTQLKYISEDNLITYTQALSDKTQTLKLLLESEIAENTQRINEEATRAGQVELQLGLSILEESSRAQTVEEELRKAIVNSGASADGALQLVKKELEEKLAAEASSRESSDASIRADYANKLSLLDEEHRSYVDSAVTAVEANYQTQDSLLLSSLNQEISIRLQQLAAQDAINLSLLSLISSEVERIDNTFDQHVVTAELNLLAHVEDKSNPHNVTAEQVGAPTIQEHQEVVDDVSDLMNYNTALTSKIDISEDSVVIKKSDVSNGKLVVQGDLVVKGTTKIVESETLAVQDNFVVLNSDGTDIDATLAGIVIRTDEETTYGIAYDTTTDSVSLGQGTYNSDGTFVFNDGESNPVLTRDISTNIEDNHVLVWDADESIAVDGGVRFIDSDEYTLVKDELQDNSKNIATLNTLTTEHTTKLNTVQQEVTDLSEAQEQLKTEFNSHEDNTSNPHGVTWWLINDQAFTEATPKMDGTTSAGTSTFVSRADHVHPVDTSRAPVDHASASGTYGKATDILYGHVQVDTSMNSGSENPVLNKVIKSYIDTAINNLDVDMIEVSPGQTLSSIQQVDGKIEVNKQDIQVELVQVSGLPEVLGQVDQTMSLIDTNSQQRDTQLTEALNTLTGVVNTNQEQVISANAVLQGNIAAEESARKSADTALNQLISNTRTDLVDMIRDDRQQIEEISNNIKPVLKTQESIDYIQQEITNGTLDPNLCYVLSFTPVVNNDVVTYVPQFTVLDDGLLG